jgi:hypothetical protein
MFERFNENLHEGIHLHSEYMSDRVKYFLPYKYTEPSCVTVFSHNIEMYPELLTILHDRYFLCTQRKNIFEQLLSRTLTYYHKNYDGEIISGKMTVDLNQFERFFYQLKKLERIQNFIISEKCGQIVDFDKLITGKENLGFEYTVTSSDQHDDLQSLIINFDEVKTLFEQLTTKF